MDGNSLQDQNLPNFPAGSGVGDGWEESGGASANILAENFLLGSSTIQVGQQISLGSAFSTGGTEDLFFRYGLENGLLLYGVVEYLEGMALLCDFDNSGTCDLTDLDLLVAEICGRDEQSSV